MIVEGRNRMRKRVRFFCVAKKSFLGMAVCGSFYVLYYLCGREKEVPKAKK
jgi:hypothetical protein